MAWFRDWWAGARYVEQVKSTGALGETIVAQEAALARRPNDTATQMMLAYLYMASGNTTRAGALWAKVERRPAARKKPPIPVGKPAVALSR